MAASVKALTPKLKTATETLIIVANVTDLNPALRLEYQGWLDDEESLRLHRIKHQRVADCFLIGRAITKQVIADFINVAPEEVGLTISSNGKPRLLSELLQADSLSTNLLHFSITHKMNTVSIGFARASLGIDIEPIQFVDKMTIAHRFFTAQEAASLESLDSAGRRDQFTKIWVLKEACVKRDGSTLAGQMGKLAFNVDGDSIQCHGNLAQGYYQLYGLTIDQRPGYLGIASSAGHGQPLECYSGLPMAGYHRQTLTLVAESFDD